MRTSVGQQQQNILCTLEDKVHTATAVGSIGHQRPEYTHAEACTLQFPLAVYVHSW